MTEPNPSICAECGAPLAKGGRPSKDGVRYCMRTACQQVKMQRYRQNIRDHDSSVAVKHERRPCSGCGDELPSRPGRITDMPVGRWCPKRGCQRDRAVKQRLMAKFEADPTSLTSEDVVEVTGMFWHMAHEVGQRDCPDCGLPGLPGFGHPDMEGVNCKGLGSFLTPRPEVERLWPERIPPA